MPATCTEYPTDEKTFEDVRIKKVSPQKSGGWEIGLKDCGCFFVPADSPVVPVPGMIARFYPGGFGFRVRGLYLGGVKVFYRTEEEDAERHEIESYGLDAADWLARWDAGRSVWSVKMGGIGPGYEQAIQIAVAEILRHILAKRYNGTHWDIKEKWTRDREKIEKASFKNETINALGLSGAQFGAAVYLAARIYCKGPRAVMKETEDKDRHILVSKNFPSG